MALRSLLWSAEAVEKLNLLAEYYASEDPQQAARCVRTLLASGRRIQGQPESGAPVAGLPRSFRVVSTRPFPFLIYYRVVERESRAVVIEIRHLSNRALKPALLRRRSIISMTPDPSAEGAER